MRNKKAEGTVWACVLTVMICMLLSLFLTFFEAIESVKASKQAAKTVLNAMVTENEVIVFDSLRDSESNIGQIAEDAYTDRLTDFSDLTDKGETLAKERNGREVYSVTSPELSTDHETVTVTYTVSVPLYFAGQKLDPAVVPVTVTAKFRDRID